ncbi:EAL domain-containing protein [Ralstonia sp. 1B3]
MAVNVSARQCDAGVIERDVDEALKASGMTPSRLELELTESVLLADRQSTQRLLMSLAARGVRISLDDFGIGFSSLSYLRSLPIHNIKIDRSFISGVPGVPDCVALTKTIIAMARALNMTVTAEGVETPSNRPFCLRMLATKCKASCLGGRWKCRHWKTCYAPEAAHRHKKTDPKI